MFDNPNLEEQRWVVIDDKNLYGSEREKKRETSPGGPGSGRVAMCRKAGLKGGETGNGKDEDREATNNATHKKTILSAI